MTDRREPKLLVVDDDPMVRMDLVDKRVTAVRCPASSLPISPSSFWNSAVRIVLPTPMIRRHASNLAKHDRTDASMVNANRADPIDTAESTQRFRAMCPAGFLALWP